MNRYRLNHYWIRLAYWAIRHVQFATDTMENDAREIRVSLSVLGMSNAKILVQFQKPQA